MTRYTKQDSDGRYYIESVNGRLESDKYGHTYGESIDRFAELENADVVEVVRCKDCKYLYCLSAVDRRFYCRHHPHGLQGINIVEDNPYCSYGERKDL